MEKAVSESVLEPLQHLFDRVQAREVEPCDPLFVAALYPVREKMSDVIEAQKSYYDDSLDAADQLRRDMLPGWRVNILKERYSDERPELWEVELIQLGPDGWHKAGNLKSNVWHPKASHAWLLAVLRALILCMQQCDGNRGEWRGQAQ